MKGDLMPQPVTAEQVLAVLQARAATDRLIEEIVRSAIIEAGIVEREQKETSDD